MCDARIEGGDQPPIGNPKNPRAGPLRLEPDPPAFSRVAPPLRTAPQPKRYFACALRAANSASLRSVMTPISLAR
jgi:hypothetical protein